MLLSIMGIFIDFLLYNSILMFFNEGNLNYFDLKTIVWWRLKADSPWSSKCCWMSFLSLFSNFFLNYFRYLWNFSKLFSDDHMKFLKLCKIEVQLQFKLLFWGVLSIWFFFNSLILSHDDSQKRLKLKKKFMLNFLGKNFGRIKTKFHPKTFKDSRFEGILW